MNLHHTYFLALVAATVGCGLRQAAPARLPFIENDYAGAMAQARSRHVPLFVDVWAPW